MCPLFQNALDPSPRIDEVKVGQEIRPKNVQRVEVPAEDLMKRRRNGQVVVKGVGALVRGTMMELRVIVVRVPEEEVGVPVVAGVSPSRDVMRMMRILGDSWYKTLPYKRLLR